jgi:O-glycosyl hydrolase
MFGINRRLDTISHTLKEILMATKELTQSITDLTAAVASESTVIQSAVTLINGFGQRILDAIAGAADETEAVTAVQAIVAQAQSDASALAAAVAANTPAAKP